MPFWQSCLPDSGATQTVVGSPVARRHNLNVLQQGARLAGLGDFDLRSEGTVVLRASTSSGRSTIIQALVSPVVGDQVFVSWHDLVALHYLPRTFPTHPDDIAATPMARCDATNDLSAAVRSSLITEFSQYVLSDLLHERPMSVGGPMKVYLRPDARPTYCSSPRKVPIRYEEEAEATVDELSKKGVIARVTTPTEWCSPAFFVPKPDGKRVRLVTDYTALNKFVDRPTHPFPSSRDIMQSISADAKVFCKMDAVHGYFQLALDQGSSLVTTFILPSGRYRYLRAPMGLSASSDEWCRRSDVIVSGLPWARKIVDDTLIWAPDWETLHARCRVVLNRCKEHGITISLRKLELGTSIPFAGFVVSSTGLRPDPQLVAAIKQFPPPTDVSTLRSFLGLANQVASFVPDLSHMTVRMRELLKKEVAWAWLPPH